MCAGSDGSKHDLSSGIALHPRIREALEPTDVTGLFRSKLRENFTWKGEGDGDEAVFGGTDRAQAA